MAYTIAKTENANILYDGYLNMFTLYEGDNLEEAYSCNDYDILEMIRTITKINLAITERVELINQFTKSWIALD